MPRLSIIVPHLNDDSGLEATLLSILENRPQDCEILVAHTGAYEDPYDLGKDEVLFIEVERKAGVCTQINESISAACAPLVHILFPGAIVQSDWTNEAVQRFKNGSLDLLGLPIQSLNHGEIYYGVDGHALPHRRVAVDRRRFAGPLMCGGVFRRKTLLKFNHFFAHSIREVAEVEMALLCKSLDLEIDVLDRCMIQAPTRAAIGSEPSYEVGLQTGRLASAYADIEESGVVIDSLAKRLGHLAGGLMSPKTVAERLGWVMGIRDRSWGHVVRERIDAAIQAIEEESMTLPMQTPAWNVKETRRRAA